MNRLFSLIILALIVISMGCSGSTVTSPGNPSDKQDSITSGLPVWVSDFDSNLNPTSGQGILGLFNVHINPGSLTGEIVSLRGSMSADVLEVVDITNFLSMAPCSDCVGLKSIQLNSDGNLVAKIGIKHPFEVGDPLKPISGRNRADLHVFNVEGIVVSDGPSSDSFPGIGATVGGFTLLNADGYTGYLDDSLDELLSTQADIHPYITHFADYSIGNFDPANPSGFASVVDPPPSGNLVMAMGCDYDIRDYIFEFPEGDINFIFAVGCSYAVSADSKNQRFTPEYRVPQHNKKAASHVNVIIDTNELAAGVTTSEAQLTIKVLDISHGVAVGVALNEMRADSSVSSIEVEIPGVTSSVVTFSTTPTGGVNRDPLNPLTFTGTVTNSAGGAEGSYIGLVKITDSYTPGLNESPLLGGQDGIKRVDPTSNPLTGVFAISEFATYQRFEIAVENANENPVAVLAPNPANGCTGTSIWFNGTASNDPDGTIVTYECDFDLLNDDPANFSADVSGSEDRVQSPPYTQGTYTAALRVIDNLGGSDIDTVEVNITDIDGFNITPYSKTYATDTSFSSIIYTPNDFRPYEWNNLPHAYGMEAMATGDAFIYAVFYANGSDGTGLYFARSGDDGVTWGDYQRIRAFASTAAYKGASITAVGNEVFITTLDYDALDYFLYYNSNSGSGDFDEYLILDEPNTTDEWGMPTIVVDPTDTDKIYAAYSYYVYPSLTVSDRVYVLTSSTGPGGTFTKSPALYSRWNGSYYEQVWSAEIKMAPDGDLYVIQVANNYISTHRSIDDGANWSRMSDQSITPFSRFADYCFDPNNSETIYLFVNQRYYNRIQYYRSTNGGTSWTTMSSSFQTGTDSAYSNVSVCTDKAGNVYAVYTDMTPGNANVYGKYSITGGGSFGSAIQISNHSGNDAYPEVIQSTNGCDVIIGWLEDFNGTPRVVTRRG